MKPVVLDGIVALIRRCLAERNQSGGPARPPQQPPRHSHVQVEPQRSPPQQVSGWRSEHGWPFAAQQRPSDVHEPQQASVPVTSHDLPAGRQAPGRGTGQ